MTKGWPRNFSALLAIKRIEGSAEPPGEKVMSILIGLVGYPWAHRREGIRIRRSPQKNITFSIFHLLGFICYLLWYGFDAGCAPVMSKLQ
jgi:hypothetical protein